MEARELPRASVSDVRGFRDHLLEKEAALHLRERLARCAVSLRWPGGLEAVLPSAEPGYVAGKDKTPVLKPEESRLLLDSAGTSATAGPRGLALLGVAVYSRARVGAPL